MKFARIVFGIAAAWGLLVLTPMLFIFNTIGRKDPPPITHPQFYFGFVTVALVFQFVFFIIATDPARFRPMIIPSVLEKATYVAVCLILYLRGEVTVAQMATAGPDLLLGILFVSAYYTSRPRISLR
jgi:hypothetical protein